MNNNDNQSFLKVFFSLGIGTFLYLIVGLIGTPIITRLVDPVDYGQMSILSVYSNIGMMLCGLGLDQTLVRYFYQEEDPSYQRKLLHNCYAIPLIFTAICGIALLISHFCGLKWMTLTELILLLINVVVLILSRFAMLLLRLRFHSKIFSLANIVQKATYIVMSVVLILLIKKHHFIILAVSTITGVLVSTVIAMLYERDLWKFPKLKTNFPIRRSELLLYGLPLMLSSSITVLFNALDKLFIEHFCTLSDVGVYASAMNLMAVFSIIKTSFTAIWMPSAVSHYEKNPDNKDFFQQGHAFISILMLCLGAAVILFKDVFVLLLGQEYHDASFILPYLMFESIMYTISETTATGMVVQKKSMYQVIVAGGACLANFIGNLILTPLYGPQGAALSTGISYIIYFAIRTALSNRVFYVNYGLHRLAISVAALFGFAAYGSNYAFSWVTVVLFLGVIAVIAIAYRKDLVHAWKIGVNMVSKFLKHK